jgi:CubicO group peptidase (beta-lactamase class C family)
MLVRANVREDFCRRPLLTLSWLLWVLAQCSWAASEEFPTGAWKTASPESQGLDSGVLAEALDYVRAKGIPAHSLLIVRNGAIVLDAYFYPYQGLEVHDVASVTKSFTSAAVGIAIEKRFLKGVDENVLSILPLRPSGSDGRKESLTIRHLLTMTSGLDCDTQGGEKALTAMRRSKDWTAFALALPMRADPGSRFAYCSCNNHLLSSLVTAATGESLLQFAEKNLFQAIGIRHVIWPSDPNGRTHGWGDLHLHPHDMARFGFLYLHHGKWGDAQVIPENWVRESSRPSVTVRQGVGYGYSWWINTAQPLIFEAVGRGGQRISVLPKENIVVVFTGGGSDTDQIAPFLFRAIRSDTAIPENPASQQRLRQALLRSSNPIPEARNVSMPQLARRTSGVTFSLSSNPLDLRSIQFDFSNRNEATVTLRFDDAKWIAPVGLDGKRRFASVGPHGLPVASVGRWVSDSEFLLDLDTVANVNHFVFNVRFHAERVHLRMNETTGEMKDVEVEGVVVKRSNWALPFTKAADYGLHHRRQCGDTYLFNKSSSSLARRACCWGSESLRANSVRRSASTRTPARRER